MADLGWVSREDWAYGDWAYLRADWGLLRGFGGSPIDEAPFHRTVWGTFNKGIMPEAKQECMRGLS